MATPEGTTDNELRKELADLHLAYAALLLVKGKLRQERDIARSLLAGVRADERRLVALVLDDDPNVGIYPPTAVRAIRESA